jgi:ABC-type dipeptide/oligopeptide/nickel transport system ATPase component
MLVGVVGSNKSATTKNVFGTAESPNVIKGGSITLGDTKVAMTAENFLTYALPWGTGKSVNANISSNTVWN